MVFSGIENEVIKAEAVSFSYSNAATPMLDRLDLSLKQSELLCLIGPGGSGKTTLLKLLAGLFIPSSGEIFFRGAPLSQLKPRDRSLILRRVSMTFQRSGLFDSKTVLENLTFPLRELNRMTPQEALAEAESILKRVDLAGHSSKYPFEISGGMQKRLGIARALVLKPEAVFYDDPTAGLDPITSNQIVDLILSVHQDQGTSSLISTSDIDLAMSISSRLNAKIAFLCEGRILQMGTAQELLDSNQPVIVQFLRGLAEGALLGEGD